MEQSGDKQSTWLCFDTSPLFFHKVTKLLQAFVIVHDETFQALAVYGDILLLKLQLDLIFDGIFRCKLPTLEMFSPICQTRKFEGPKLGLHGGLGTHSQCRVFSRTVVG
jgi:hypothetical protein